MGISVTALGLLGAVGSTQFQWLLRLREQSFIIMAIGGASIAWAIVVIIEPAGVCVNRPDGLSELVQVTRVIDGDTIVVNLSGRNQTVRYIGMDTPETVHPTRPIEYYGPEASVFNKVLVEGKTVWIERDISQTDQFGRLVRYVWLGNDLVNATLVQEGYARAVSFPPDVRCGDLFGNSNRRLLIMNEACGEDNAI